ncbi:MAG: hypothetical protein H6606_06050 [Flavobacteriales bacterium]|nr:hypothetical protein [Flavobacteriales bacterium]
MAKQKTQPTEQQIQEWKEKYTEVYSIQVGDKHAVIRFPDFKTFQQAIEGLQKAGANAYVQAILNNCIIWGDSDIAQTDEDFFNIKEQFDELLEFADVQMKKDGNHYLITVEDKEFRCRPITREIINLAEREDQGGRPYVRNMNILKRVLIEGDQEVLNTRNPYYYIPLLSKMEQLYEKKVVAIKKY